MVIPFAIDSIRKYALKEDTAEQKTFFHLGYLGAAEHSYINSTFTKTTADGESDKPKISFDWNGMNLETVRLGLRGVENFGGVSFTFTEKQYPFGKRKVLSDESLNLVTPWIGELAAEITAQAAITGEQEKNS